MSRFYVPIDSLRCVELLVVRDGDRIFNWKSFEKDLILDGENWNPVNTNTLTNPHQILIKAGLTVTIPNNITGWKLQKDLKVWCVTPF
jgi:hypothetical protein